jgi:hypothetical protein
MIPKKTTKGMARRRGKRIVHEIEGAAGGAVAGAVGGAIAGPAGVVAGAVLGGLAGAAAESALEEAELRRGSRARELDAQIGLTGGDLGAPNLEHPPARIGAYSAASAGAAQASHAPAEGPMQSIDGEDD